jgi:hypothetical protein
LGTLAAALGLMEAIGRLQITPAMQAAKIPLSQHLSNELTQAEIASPIKKSYSTQAAVCRAVRDIESNSRRCCVSMFDTGH